MAYNPFQFSLDTGGDFSLTERRVEYRDIIVDRKSRYTITAFQVQSFDDVKKAFSELKEESYFQKATHNSYAYRLRQENGSILE